MLMTPMDILKQFPIRKSRRQKQDFREWVQAYVTEMGYSCATETGRFGVNNLVMGDPEQAKYVISAHYDTCARMIVPNLITPCNIWAFMAYQLIVVAIVALPAIAAGFLAGFVSTELSALASLVVFWVLLILMMAGPANPCNVNDNSSGVITLLEIMRTLPENQRHKVCFVLFDLEEAGLLGSAAYRRKHKKATNQQIVLNMDCVGDGDHLMIFPTKKLQKDRKRLTSLYKVCGYFGSKSLLVHEKGFAVYPSDQVNFPYGAAIAAFRNHKRAGLYYSRIHTPRDTILEETNVNILRAALTTFICCDAAQ